jgi:hypothetical protein
MKQLTLNHLLLFLAVSIDNLEDVTVIVSPRTGKDCVSYFLGNHIKAAKLKNL